MRKRKTDLGKRKSGSPIAILSLLLLLSGVAAAAEIRSVTMERSGKTYEVLAVTWLAADPDFVLAVLLDYDEFHRLSGGITETRWLPETEQDQPLAYTRIDSCVAFFCRRLEKVERIKVTGNLSFTTNVLPARSDFHVFNAAWRLQANEGGTTIRYQLEMRPAFWVPPLIGPWAIRRKAESSALEIAQRIEYLAANSMALEEFDLEAYHDRD